MAYFGVETEESEIINAFVIDTNQKLQKADVVKNPFSEGKILKIRNGLFVYMKALYFNIALYVALFSIIVILIFNGFHWTRWFGIPIFFLVLGFFWSKYFFYAMMLWGLKKRGYKGRFKLLSNEESFKRLIFWDNKK